MKPHYTSNYTYERLMLPRLDFDIESVRIPICQEQSVLHAYLYLRKSSLIIDYNFAFTKLQKISTTAI